MDPLLSIQIYNDPPVYRPGDVMRFDLQIDGIDLEDLSAVETSVLWTTEGKGDEDLGIHFFQRHIPSDAEGDVRSLKACNITLPNSPLSYEWGPAPSSLDGARANIHQGRSRVLYRETLHLEHEGNNHFSPCGTA